jgi:hypothetical protein
MEKLTKDAPRPGRKPKIGTRRIQRVVTMTTRQQPSNATHWRTRTMAGDSRHQRSQRATDLAGPRHRVEKQIRNATRDACDSMCRRRNGISQN